MLWQALRKALRQKAWLEWLHSHAGPEDDFISFHIQGVGRWTNNLYSLCKERYGASEDADFSTASSTIQKRDVESGLNAHERQDQKARRLLVHIDGPFGSPAQDHSSFSCLLLVVGGIPAPT